jgi:CRISPR-associated protein Cas1
MVVYVTEQGAEVGLLRARLVVRKGQRQLETIRIDELEQLVLCGVVQITTQAMRALLRKGVETAFLTQSGAFVGRLSGPSAGRAELRRTQYRALERPEAALDLARRIVAGKIRNQRSLLLRFQRRRPHERVARALVSLRLLGEDVPAAPDLDVLRGLEGRAAADYFAAFGALIGVPDITFDGRKRRPPPDPVNILLSFGYTLLGHLVQGYCELAGLDPHLGALHAVSYGRPSLALDLMEEMRPVVVDAAVLRAINTRAVRADDFVPVDPGAEAPVEDAWDREEEEDAPAGPRRLLLTPSGARRWFAVYERRLNEQTWYPSQERRLTHRQVVREQVYLLARHLRGEAEYAPFAP